MINLLLYERTPIEFRILGFTFLESDVYFTILHPLVKKIIFRFN